MSDAGDLEERLARLIEAHARTGVMPGVESITGDRPDLREALDSLVREYLGLAGHLEMDAGRSPEASPDGVFTLDGFRTVETIARGGMGMVYKLEDQRLGRIVAAKVLHATPGHASRLSALLREAKSLALFSDPRIVRIFEFRADASPPVIIMEYVEGFELGQLGPSLEFHQRARILRDIADAVHHAHTLGIQHRDLKPSNIMLTRTLEPKILDFGLSDGDPSSGHLRGTPAYVAPEQLDRTQPIDARTDVYALGVMLYELASGSRPYEGPTDELLEAIREGRPRLPVEIDPRVPEPLQAIALKAMERDPAQRYASAKDLSRDLTRFLDGLPVTARPTRYATTLRDRVGPHLLAIEEWRRLKLIYPHEAARLHATYRQLAARDDDWIVASRALTPSQIALYLGAFLLLAGSLFYFAAHQIYETTGGLLEPVVTLGVPLVGLHAAGRWLYHREHRAVAVAFYLAGVGLLPLLLLIWLDQAGLWMAPSDSTGQLFDNGAVSNRQLQVSFAVSCAWAAWLAFRTRTAALSTVATTLALLLAFALLADVGLRQWIEDGHWDVLGLHLGLLAGAYGLAGGGLERATHTWFARPVYVAAALTLLVSLDLVALDGRLFDYLGISLVRLNPADVTDPTLVDTVGALTLNGIVFYVLSEALERRGTEAMTAAGLLLVVLAPFSILEPMAWLSGTGEYSRRVDWAYLALAIAIALLAYRRQRRSFYYAGLVNTGFALYFVADHHDWFDQPVWAMTVVAAGLAGLTAGFLLDARRRDGDARRGPESRSVPPTGRGAPRSD